MDVPVIFVITHRQSKKDKNYYFCFFQYRTGFYTLYPKTKMTSLTIMKTPRKIREFVRDMR